MQHHSAVAQRIATCTAAELHDALLGRSGQGVVCDLHDGCIRLCLLQNLPGDGDFLETAAPARNACGASVGPSGTHVAVPALLAAKQRRQKAESTMKSSSTSTPSGQAKTAEG